MSRFIVAGAGHGGLVAAAKLSQKGHQVTVIEKRREEELGHDWEDRFTFSLLEDACGIKEEDLPQEIWRYRGDCAFVAPAKKKKIVIRYNDDNRQKLMWRKPLIRMLIENAKKCGVKFRFSTEITGPLVRGSDVIGVKIGEKQENADCVIDAAGVFSPVRSGLPKHLGIENMPKYGDLFYAYRVYFNRDTSYEMPDVPFEVYLYHEHEQGLSWCCTNEDSVDILIGRIDPLTDEKVKDMIDSFREDHPWIGSEILHGGHYGRIPVRRPLSLMVANGYAAIGDSAFMTTPMNGMGIDLSLKAGLLLSEVLLKDTSYRFRKETLWEYNRRFHSLYGADVAKNEGLKNALLSMPGTGVDFLFESDVIEPSDLEGGGESMNVASLMGKVSRGMKRSDYFLPLLNGLLRGRIASMRYKKVPDAFGRMKVLKYSKDISKMDILFETKK